jgi:hypothetical protein
MRLAIHLSELGRLHEQDHASPGSLAIHASLAFVMFAASPGIGSAQTAVPVIVDNFALAETDRYLAANTKEAGGLGSPLPLAGVHRQSDRYPMNRDTLYSFGVFDLAARLQCERILREEPYDAYSINNITGKKLPMAR